MRKVFILLVIVTIHFTLSRQVFSQFNLPKIPKIGKTKPGKEGTNGQETTNGNEQNNSETKQKMRADNKLLYTPQRPTSTPVLLKNTVYVQAKTHNEYWKVPKESNYSSWVPEIRFETFYNNDKSLNYTVEFFNPDGTSWFSDKLQQGTSAADRTVRFESSNTYDALNTKSTVATGTFSFKVTDQDTKEVLYQGKFTVGKFKTSDRPQEKKFDFFVDHDWLMPFAMIGFHHSLDEVGGMPPEISVWIKGPVNSDELEGRVFYKGKQIASTKDGDGSSGVSDYDERTTQFAPPFAPLNFWKRWQFEWGNLRFDNNGSFNHDYYPNAHYADKNPGDYTVKIYRNGAQIRELSFSIGADGRFVVPAYMSQMFLPYYRFIVPVKVLGASEKWNPNEWKTNAFYGNPLNGFAVQ